MNGKRLTILNRLFCNRRNIANRNFFRDDTGALKVARWYGLSITYRDKLGLFEKDGKILYINDIQDIINAELFQ